MIENDEKFYCVPSVNTQSFLLKSRIVTRLRPLALELLVLVIKLTALFGVVEPAGAMVT